MAASIMPVKASINQLMLKACLRTRTLHETHPIRAYLPKIWKRSENNIVAPFPYKEWKTVDSDGPIKHIYKLATRLCHKKYNVLLEENRLGDRLVDAHQD